MGEPPGVLGLPKWLSGGTATLPVELTGNETAGSGGSRGSWDGGSIGEDVCVSSQAAKAGEDDGETCPVDVSTNPVIRGGGMLMAIDGGCCGSKALSGGAPLAPPLLALPRSGGGNAASSVGVSVNRTPDG